MRLFIFCIAIFGSTIQAMDYGSSWAQEARERIARVKNGADPAILNEAAPGNVASFLRLAVQYSWSHDLMDELLEMGADPNFKDSYCRPIDCAGSERAVTALLRYGAQPTSKALDAVVICYFCLKPKNISDDDWRNEGLGCLQLLYEKGADIHVEWDIGHPIFRIISSDLISQADKRALVSFFIARGIDCNRSICTYEKMRAEEHSVFCHFKNSKNEQDRDWYSFIKEAYRKNKYPRARLLLISYYKKERDNQLSRLPKDLINCIGTMVMAEEDSEKECPIVTHEAAQPDQSFDFLQNRQWPGDVI